MSAIDVVAVAVVGLWVPVLLSVLSGRRKR